MLKAVLQYVFVGFAVWLILHKIDLYHILNILKQCNLCYLTIGIMLSIVSTGVSGLRSHYYLKANNIIAQESTILSWYFIGNFFNLSLPGGIGGDGYRIFIINKKLKCPKGKAFRIILCERVNGFYVLILLGLILFYWTTFYELPYASFLHILALIAITPCYYTGLRYVLRDSTKVAIRAAGYSIIIQLLQIAMALVLLKSLQDSNDIILYTNFIFLFIVGSVLSILPISIGSIGIRELTFLYGLSSIGREDLIALGVTFGVISFAAYAFIGILGGVTYLCNNLGNAK